DALTDSGNRFLRACRRQRVDATPIWFMRQAGRYMGEYRSLRERYTLLDICRTPDLATEVTLQPVRRIEVDAAILFSDLLLPFEHTKSLMYGHPAAWHQFCDTAADVIGEYLVAQIEAGVDAVQIFDSWVGALNAADYREFILPHTKKIFDRVRARNADAGSDV